MAARSEVLVFCCPEEDLEVLRSASLPDGPVLRIVRNEADCTREAVTRDPAGLIIGIGEQTLSRLDVLSVIRAVKKNPAVIVVAEEDSLDLERNARQRNIFYYLVHPIDRSEAEAVLHDVTRRSQDGC